MKVYLIGSLRNPEVPIVANKIRAAGHECFDDWFAAGPEADDKWQAYEQGRNHTMAEALDGLAAQHVFKFDREHLDRADVAVLLLPAGRSGHLELGYMLGRGKTGYIVYPSPPERWDVMYNFATGVYTEVEPVIERISAMEQRATIRHPFDDYVQGSRP